jgi:hypothetical protein
MNRIIGFLAILLISAISLTVNAQDVATATPTDSVAQVKPTRRYYIDVQTFQAQISARGTADLKIVAGKIFHDYAKTSDADFKKFCESYQIKTQIDAINMLCLIGWQLSQTYSTTVGGNAITHTLFYKDVTSPEELRAGLQPTK